MLSFGIIVVVAWYIPACKFLCDGCVYVRGGKLRRVVRTDRAVRVWQNARLVIQIGSVSALFKVYLNHGVVEMKWMIFPAFLSLLVDGLAL